MGWIQELKTLQTHAPRAQLEKKKLGRWRVRSGVCNVYRKMKVTGPVAAVMACMMALPALCGDVSRPSHREGVWDRHVAPKNLVLGTQKVRSRVEYSHLV